MFLLINAEICKINIRLKKKFSRGYLYKKCVGFKGYVILYYKSNLFYTVFFPKFLIFQKIIVPTRRDMNMYIWALLFFQALKILEKLRKRNCSCGKVPQILNIERLKVIRICLRRISLQVEFNSFYV